VVDYKKFLRAPESDVPVLYLGGFEAYAADRTLRLGEPRELAPGFYSAKVKGRRAELGGRAEPFGLEALPAHDGHFAGGYVALPGAKAARLELLGESEPDALAPVRARMHPTGVLLLAETKLEDEAEPEARSRLDEGRGLDGLRGVGATLRVAFALETAQRVARDMRLDVAPAEILPQVMPIAEEGAARARALLTAILLRRREEAGRLEEQARARAMAHAHEALREHVRQTAHRILQENAPRLTPVERADRALTAAQATLLHARRISERGRRPEGAHQMMEVRFRFMGEIFISVVDDETLHVFDAGICLAGADEEVTLESLPSVIREAIEEERLVITRR
jgi:hypothetical protein